MIHGLVLAVTLMAADVEEQQPQQSPDWRRGVAFEVNVLWPFFPGGLAELKVLVPVVRGDKRDWRGELVTGLHSDYGWGPITRPADNYGKVFLLAAKLGWRQFLVYGFHVEVALHAGWRHEEKNVHDGTTVDGFTGRLWMMAGWQYELNERVYLNVRGGGGLHLWRSDHLGYTERRFAPAGDINLGIRF